MLTTILPRNPIETWNFEKTAPKLSLRLLQKYVMMSHIIDVKDGYRNIDQNEVESIKK